MIWYVWVKKRKPDFTAMNFWEMGEYPENRLGGAAEYGLDARCILLESDVTLFFRGGEDLLAGKKLRLPELSHT